MRVSVMNEAPRTIIDFLVTPIGEELKAEKVIGCTLEGQAILESCLYLHAFLPIAGNAVVGGLRYCVQNDVVFKLRNDFPDIANQPAINGKFPVWKC
ncbi:hypothetical protein D9M09_13150 [Janthinobacterium agaricidamnosum]|uniref:Uncharacterized protein n=1 Tax=Janthinobacterium agaricidamnosum TaxID=55508 RepID=A0A3G2E964_9BURK|nr:hypothetical protein D9M09_13150 [Janthinobacterium agaricidamnosum]